MAGREGARGAGVRWFWRGAEAREAPALVAVRSERGARAEHDGNRRDSDPAPSRLAVEAADRGGLRIDRVVAVGASDAYPTTDARRTTTCPRTVGLLGTLARVQRALERAPGDSGTLIVSRDGRLSAGRPSEWGTCRVHASGELACLVQHEAPDAWHAAPVLRWTIGEQGPRPAHLGPEVGLPRFVPRNERLLVDPPGALSGRSVDGRRLFRGLVPRLAGVLADACARNGLGLADVAHVVLQHANAPLLDALLDAAGLAAGQVAWNRSFVDDAECASIAEVLGDPGAEGRSGPVLVAEFECGYSITATVVTPPTTAR